MESGAEVPMQCKSRNRVTERRRRGGVKVVKWWGKTKCVAEKGKGFYGKIDVIVRCAVKSLQ